MFNFFKEKFVDESLEDQRKDLEKYPEELSNDSLNGLDCDMLSDAVGEFGRTLTNPIPVNGPVGEIKYINRLRTKDGGLIFHRLGSKDAIDIFETVSMGGKIWDILYLDMYHPRRSTIAPSGYTFSKFHDIFSRFPYGYFTTSFDQYFPFGLSESIEKGLGGKSLVKRYEEVIKDKVKFLKPTEHNQKLAEISMTG